MVKKKLSPFCFQLKAQKLIPSSVFGFRKRPVTHTHSLRGLQNVFFFLYQPLILLLCVQLNPRMCAVVMM